MRPYPAIPRGSRLRPRKNEDEVRRPVTGPVAGPSPGQLHFEPYIPRSHRRQRHSFECSTKLRGGWENHNSTDSYWMSESRQLTGVTSPGELRPSPVPVRSSPVAGDTLQIWPTGICSVSYFNATICLRCPVFFVHWIEKNVLILFQNETSQFGSVFLSTYKTRANPALRSTRSIW